MKVKVNKQSINLIDTTLVSNSVGIYECEFEFIDWDGWNKTAVFQLDDENSIEVIIVNNKAIIPFEVLVHSGWLKIGVYGTLGEKIMPTVWSKRIEVKNGVTTGSPYTPPTPSVYEQILEELQNRADGIAYEGDILSLLSGETILAQVTITGGGSISSVEIRMNGEVLQYRIDNGEWMSVKDFGSYATDSEVASSIATALTGYATRVWVEEQGYLTEHQSLENYYTKIQADGKFLTEHQSLDNYYTKNVVDTALGTKQEKITQANKLPYSLVSGVPDIPSLEGYATKEYVDTADAELQSQIDALVSKSDVVDVVGTYAELQAYDTSTLLVNDVVKVLDDNTHSNSRSYYRWSGSAWTYVGSESVGYTKSETDTLLDAKQNTINDLSTIRSGASAGATAVQPSDISDMATKTWVEGKGYGTYTKPSSGIPASDLAQTYYLASNPNGYTDNTVANSKYTKPSGGIPKTDLASAVQTSLGKADSAYQKPSGGIPASDIASGVIPTVPTNVSAFSNDSGYLTLATLPIYNGGVQ